MALHWKHLKGFYKDGANAYTYINFTKGGQTGENCLPIIKYLSGDTDNENSATLLGHIVTTGVSNSFTQDQYISKGKSWGWVDSGSSIANIGRDNAKLYLSDSSSIQLNVNGGTKVTVTSSAVTLTPATTIQSTLNVSGAVTLAGVCNAQYFNATSDVRAKTNIQPLSFNALDFIKNLNLYSFNYISNNNPSIGILAQEVQNIDINGFKLVDNENATGENNDYMALRESKLVYILLEAVKELEAEVADLKAQLK